MPYFFRSNTSSATISSVETVDGDIYITPNDRRLVIKVSDPIVQNTTVMVDPTNAQVGDELVIFIKGTSDSFVISFPKTNFFLTFCGSTEGEGEYYTTNIGAGRERWTFQFFFDGEKYVNTYDNC